MNPHSPENPSPLHGALVDLSAQEQQRKAAASAAHASPHANVMVWVMVLALIVSALAGCALLPTAAPSETKAPSTSPTPPSVLPGIREALGTPSRPRTDKLPPAVAQALVPAADLSMPTLAGRNTEPRFDLNVANLPIAQVLSALARDTRYSIVLDPELKGNVNVNLKDVTLLEALDTLRELYGYEYRVQGTRIFVQNAALTTRVFQINYLNTNRSGRSDVRVTSGSIALGSGGGGGGGSSGGSGSGSGSGSSGNSGSNSSQPSSGGSSTESSRITTHMRNDLWAELDASLRLLLGNDGKPGEGRQLIVSPQSGVIVVRALPRELRAIEQYLRAARLNVERQVMLEAKIVDVRLRQSAQSGINWATFAGGGAGQNHRGSFGLLNPGTQLSVSGNLTGGTLTANPGNTLNLGAAASSGLMGLAFQTGSFAALLSFLETQGEVQVLSSPRIAALNNQKAVLKVGTDDFFVTSVSTNIQSNTSGSNVVTPTITVQPFFSGIALDVTPQIDEDGNITLHVHPSVSNVTERNKVLNLGDLGSFTLPLASSSVSETDTIVRARDGNIVAIGGLMKTARGKDRTQVPGAGNLPLIGALFGSRSEEIEKHELVILIKPTVIHTDAQADALRNESLERIEAMTPAPTGR